MVQEMQVWTGGFCAGRSSSPDAVRLRRASKSDGKPEAFMRRESLALTEQIGALAANGEYVKLMTVSGELLEETEAVGAQDFTQPTAVYRIAVTDDMLKKVVSGAGMEPLGEETLAALRSRLNAAFFATW